MADFDVDTFRENFPEFASTTKYTDEMIEFWSGLADKLLDTTRWTYLGIRTEGISLFTAHQITLAAMNEEDAAAGVAPGRSTRPTSSESVGGVSVSYDGASSAELNGGHWNETVYGRQYLRLARIAGMGGVFV